MEQQNTPEVLLKLTARGVYTWAIKVPALTPDEPANKIVERVVEFDRLLSDKFPNHALTRGTARIRGFDPLEDD